MQRHGEVKWAVIPRSREVGQSWASSLGTTLVACLHCVWLVGRGPPDLLLVNGPGTCVPVVGAAVLMRLLGCGATCITFLESVCRVQSLSLTGRILLPLADALMVQWPALAEKCVPHLPQPVTSAALHTLSLPRYPSVQLIGLQA